MKTLTLIFLFLVFSSNIAFPQTKKSPCSVPEASQFNFWLGDWNVEWTDKKGSIHVGSNKVEKILDGCVVLENFDGGPSLRINGKSFSMYNIKAKIWQQTWVDNLGGYMQFSGKFKDDKMILGRSIKGANNQTIYQRMVFHDITQSGFIWDWEASEDLGKSWKLNWQIRYKRK